MAKWGSADFKQLKELQARLQRFEKFDADAFCNKMAKELAARLLRKLIKKTPVGEYSDTVSFTTSSGEEVSFKLSGGAPLGGTLRRGWTTNKPAVSGNAVSIELINPVEYASYVNYGHRTAYPKSGPRGWVKGQFFVEYSVAEIQDITEPFLQKRLEQELKRQLFGGE